MDVLNKRSFPYIRLNTDEVKNLENSILIDQTTETYPKFTSVWLRRYLSPEKLVRSEDSVWLLDEYKSFLYNLITSSKYRMMSDPYNIDRAENKAFQLTCARDLGFDVPRTLITGDSDRIENFFDLLNGEMVVKPIYSNRLSIEESEYHIFTNKIQRSELKNLRSAFTFPSIYQEFIDKEFDIRVTVVGDKAYSAFVESQKNIETLVDWRRKRVPFEVYDLPQKIQDKCIALVKSLGLSFGAIDIVKSKNGQYFFLEINPNGQWGWIEADTGLPLSEKIVEWLRGDDV
ncbi:RimK-like ATP-grasp domain protein [Leptospira sp. B5-022]|nr:RimK-like ATP-grasp domain protein [Leptospira sp. B5-022]